MNKSADTIKMNSGCKQTPYFEKSGAMCHLSETHEVKGVWVGSCDGLGVTTFFEVVSDAQMSSIGQSA